MDSELKQKWLQALRSGRYRQTRGKLKARNGACCCLGVLCHVAGVEWDWHEDEFGEAKYFANGNTNYLTGKLAAKVGLMQQPQITLAELNDGDESRDKPPHDFHEIADYIEKNL